MAASDKPFRDQRTLDIVFAVSNILMLLTVVWMLWDDYAREYKTEQRAFRDVEVAMAQRTALTQLPDTAEFDKAEAAVKTAREVRKNNESTLDAAREEMRRLQPKKESAEAAYQAAKAEVASKNSFLEIALEHREESTVKKLRDTLVELQSDLAKKEAARDKIVNDMKEEQLKLDKYETPYTQAAAEFKKVCDKLDAQVKAALSKTWGWGDRIRTTPVINGFADPLKIQQFTINDIPIDYNFKYVTRYDRCMSCHLGIDRPTYTRDNLLALTHDANKAKLDEAIALYKRRTETLDPKDTGGIPNPGDIRLVDLGKETLSPGRIKAFTAHPRLDLYVGSNSKHPAEKFGCSACHYGQGSGTSFLDSSHTPNDAKTRAEWTKTKHWAPNHDWDFPMLPDRFIESSCLKCHHEVTDLISTDNRVEAPKVVRGFNLIKENGCFGCHEISGWKSGNRIGPDLRLEPSPPLEDLTPIERDHAVKDTDNRPGALRKVGPALSRVSEKVKDGWIEKWLYAPSTFRPDTKMPHYFNLSTNNPDALKKYDAINGTGPDGKPDKNFLAQEKFPNTEIASIAHFLTVTSKQYVDGIATHQHDDEAVKLADETALLELLNKGRLDKDDQKKFDDLKQKIKFRKEMKPVKEDAVPKGDAKTGRKLFIERGCLACHTHQGTEPDVTGNAVFGPNLSQLPAKVGTTDASHKWLTRWILDPKAYSPRTRMPNTHLTPQEAADVAAWLLGQPARDLGQGWEAVDVKPPDMKELQDLATVYLTRMLSKRDIERFFQGKKGAQNDLAVTVILNDVTDDEKKLFDNVTDANALKYYLGKKAVNRLGCFGCHDIPGFANAKPIGTGLNDWGKKPADRLAFEDIGNFFASHYYPVEALTDKNGKPHPIKVEDGVKKEPYEEFYADVLLGHRPERMGYLNQKIRAPRSFDFNRVRVWDDRSRMPKFTFSRPRMNTEELAALKDAGDDEAKVNAVNAAFTARSLKDEAEAREAVASFILGLTAEQVPVKSINTPTGDRLAEVKGRQVLDQFNCAGCHLIRPGLYDFKPDTKSLEAKFEFSANEMTKQGEIPFLNHHNWVGRDTPTSERVTAHAVFPKLNVDDPAAPLVIMRLSEALKFMGEDGKPRNIPSSVELLVPLQDLSADWEKITTQAEFDRRFGAVSPYGGAFSTLLVPYLIAKDPKVYLRLPTGDSDEARAALPPTLIGQGARTQPEWLNQFLLDPQKVRKMSILRMPKFNMSKDEARTLTDYFSGVTHQINPGIAVPYPFEAPPARAELDSPYWRKKTADYVKRLQATDARDKDGNVVKNKAGAPLKAYQQRVLEYTPLWEKLGKLQEATLNDDLKKLAELNEFRKKQIAAKEETLKAKQGVAADLQKDIDALKQSIKDSAGDKEKIEAALKQLDVASFEKVWRETEALAADGYRLLTSRDLCTKCHQVGNIVAGEQVKQGPPLALAHARLRPEWIERWVDKPQRFVPYGSLMPTYFSAREPKWQQYHTGPALEQIETLRDVLMNFPRISSLPINKLHNPDMPAGK